VGAHVSPWTTSTTVVDILLNNLGVGLFLATTVCVLVDRERFFDAALVAWPLAVAIIAADLLVLVVDLGDPWRAFHMFRVVKPGTPMSVGVWALSALMALLAVPAAAGVLSLFVDPPTWLDGPVTVLAALALVPGVFALAYKGVLFSTTAQPGWRAARWWGAHLCASGLLLGTTILLVVTSVAGDGGASDGLRAATVGLTALTVASLALHERSVGPEPVRPRRLVIAATLALVAAALLVAIAGGVVVATAALAATTVSAVLVRHTFVALPR
jgi:hypothetical protein